MEKQKKGNFEKTELMMKRGTAIIFNLKMRRKINTIY